MRSSHAKRIYNTYRCEPLTILDVESLDHFVPRKDRLRIDLRWGRISLSLQKPFLLIAPYITRMAIIATPIRCFVFMPDYCP